MNSLLAFVLLGAGFSLVFAVGSDKELAELLSKHRNFQGRIDVGQLTGGVRDLIVGPVNSGSEIPMGVLNNFHLVVSYTASHLSRITGSSVWDRQNNLKLSPRAPLDNELFEYYGFGSVDDICRCTLKDFVTNELARIISKFIEGKELTKMRVAVESKGDKGMCVNNLIVLIFE